MDIENKKSKQLNISRVLLLVLCPTILLTGTYILIGLRYQKLPSLMLFFLLALVILFPLELCFILRGSKLEYGRYSLKSAFENQKKMNVLWIIAYGLLLFAFAGICSAMIAPLENKLLYQITSSLNERIPVYFMWDNIEFLRGYSQGMLNLTLVLYFIFNVIIGPVVEELFFRGYLTNKISRFGILAPVIVTVLFSIYHLWLPFNNIFRIAIFLPASLLAWKKKNIYISMAFHISCNLFSTINFIMLVCR